MPENIAEGVSIFGIEGTHRGDVGGVPNTCDITVDLSRLHDINGMLAYTGVDPSGTLTEPMVDWIRDAIWDYTVAVGSCLVVWLNGCPKPTIDTSNSDVTALYNSWDRYGSEYSYEGAIAFGLPNSLTGHITITLTPGYDDELPDELPEL
jgi:hypothetical protein